MGVSFDRGKLPQITGNCGQPPKRRSEAPGATNGAEVDPNLSYEIYLKLF